MTHHNSANERIKRQYFTYLADALGHSEQTMDAVAKAISRFEAYTRYKDFKRFHIEQAKAFKRDPESDHTPAAKNHAASDLDIDKLVDAITEKVMASLGTN